MPLCSLWQHQASILGSSIESLGFSLVSLNSACLGLFHACTSILLQCSIMLYSFTKPMSDLEYFQETFSRCVCWMLLTIIQLCGSDFDGCCISDGCCIFSNPNCKQRGTISKHRAACKPLGEKQNMCDTILIWHILVSCPRAC